MIDKYCDKNCKCHPKTNMQWERTHICEEDDHAFVLKVEHSRGTPVLKRKDCPHKGDGT
jgi:hypothetical protein